MKRVIDNTNYVLEDMKKRCEEGYLFGNGYKWYIIQEGCYYEKTSEDGFYNKAREIDEDEIREAWAKNKPNYIKNMEDNKACGNPLGEAYEYQINKVDEVNKENTYQYSLF